MCPRLKSWPSFPCGKHNFFKNGQNHMLPTVHTYSDNEGTVSKETGFNVGLYKQISTLYMTAYVYIYSEMFKKIF
jgi:hypothetical protein